MLAAMILDLEARLIDAALDMADRIIGGSFTRGNNKQRKSYAGTTRDVGRIMRLFDRTVAALEEAQESGIDGFVAVAAAVNRRGNVSAARSRSDEHTSELQSLMRHSYAVFCLKKKTYTQQP